MPVSIMLVGCGGDSGSGGPDRADGEPVTLEFWTMPFGGHTEDDIDGFVEEFNDAHDDIEVNVTHLQWADGRDKITQAVGAGIGPDVFIMAPLNQDFLSAGALASLTELGFDDADLDPFLDILDEAASHDGDLYAVPMGYFANVLYYNADILAEYGFDAPPTTWTQLKEMAATITTESEAAGKPVAGFQVKGMDDHLNAINHTWASFYFQAGGRHLTDNLSQARAASPEGVEALEYLRGFFADGTSPVGVSAAGGFMDGVVAMFTFQQMHVPEIAESGLTDEWALAPMPEGPVSGTSYVDAEFLVANADTADPDAAGTFIKWMTSPEQTARYMEKAPLFPYELDKVDAETREAVEAIIADDPNRGVLLEQLARADGLNMKHERYAQSARWEAQKQYIVAALNGEISAQEALEAIDREVGQALATTAR